MNYTLWEEEPQVVITPDGEIEGPIPGRVLLPGDPRLEDTLSCYPEKVQAEITAGGAYPIEDMLFVEVLTVVRSFDAASRVGENSKSNTLAARVHRAKRARWDECVACLLEVCRHAVVEAVLSGWRVRIPFWKESETMNGVVVPGEGVRISAVVALPKMLNGHSETAPPYGFHRITTPPDTDNMDKTVRDPMQGLIVGNDGQFHAGCFIKHHVNKTYPEPYLRCWMHPV